MQSRPVDWKFVCEFYDVDSSKTSRMAPKLTRRHLDLPPFSMLRVKIAAQVLRHSAVTGMKVMAEWGIISEDATHTADFSGGIRPAVQCLQQLVIEEFYNDEGCLHWAH